MQGNRGREARSDPFWNIFAIKTHEKHGFFMVFPHAFCLSHVLCHPVAITSSGAQQSQSKALAMATPRLKNFAQKSVKPETDGLELCCLAAGDRNGLVWCFWGCFLVVLVREEGGWCLEIAFWKLAKSYPQLFQEDSYWRILAESFLLFRSQCPLNPKAPR